MPEKTLSHLTEEGTPQMVDVGAKQITQRLATAQATVTLGAEIMQHLEQGELQTRKGPVFQTAIIAATMAVKKTSDLIPLCHPLPIHGCEVTVTPCSETAVRIACTVKTEGKTGVEMEALTGASVAALTIYDMCKALSHHIEISSIQLIEKTGGKHDFKRA